MRVLFLKLARIRALFLILSRNFLTKEGDSFALPCSFYSKVTADGTLCCVAFIPQDGQSVLDLFDQKDRAAIEERVQRGGEGWLLPPREPAHYGITTEEDTRWAWEKFGMQPFKTWQQPVRLTNLAASTLPRTYMFCTATEGFPFAPSAQRARTEASWRYRELATAHFAMITAPRELTQMLLELV